MLNSKFKIFLGIVLIFVLASTINAQTIIRVNCGGDDYGDHEGNLWAADQSYTTGGWGYVNPGYFLFYDYPISGTSDDPLYQHEHNALDSYHFTVPNGTYVVTLKFAELYYDNIGDRIFHVDIEGSRVLSNFDILTEVNFAEALDKTYQVDVTDGVLDINFITIEVSPGVTIAHANIKAIGVVEQGSHEPKLWIDPHELDYYNFSHKRYFEVKNGGEQPLEWNCFEDPDETWISNVTPTSGMLYQGQTQRVEVFVDRYGLEDGEYQGKISITSNGGDDAVIIKMEVETDVPISEIYPSSMDYGSILTQRKFIIENVGTAQLDWTAKNKYDDPWIMEISPTSGALSPGQKKEILVSIDRSGLTDSTYQGIIDVNTNGGDEDIKINLTTTQNPLGINCGGSQLEDNYQTSWFYDLGFTGGHGIQTDQNIQNTENDGLYKTARAGMSKYQFTVQKNGIYRISLHFAEIEHDGPGARIFDVQIEDSLVLSDFDIFAESGKYFAIIQSFSIEIKDNQLDILFTNEKGEPCISAIEVNEIPFLQTELTSLNFASILTKRKFSFTNHGTLDLNWSAKNDNNEAWLVDISPIDGSLAPFDTQVVTITIDRGELTDSMYQGNMMLETDGGNQDISLMFETKNKPFRMNCGSTEYIDGNGTTWFSDILFNGGELNNCQDSIANSNDDQLYQTTRSGMTSYEFPVQKNGLYRITLHFAEFEYSAPGERVFNVQIEDSLVLENLDIYSESGWCTALVKNAIIEVNDNQFDIAFNSQTGEPCVAAIEIFQIPIMALEPISLNFGSLLTRRIFTLINTGNVELHWTTRNPNNDQWLKEISPINGTLAPLDTQLITVTIDRYELGESSYQGEILVETDGGDQNVSLVFETDNEPLRINCGGSKYLDANEKSWFSDIFFEGGQLTGFQDSVANTADDLLYQTVHSGMTKYELPVQYNGLYKISFHFAEFEHNSPGQRVFDIQVEDSLVLENFDIYTEVGNNAALVKSAKVVVNDNQIDISFQPKSGSACISALEISRSPIMNVEPTSLNYGSLLTNRTFYVINAGNVDLNWSANNQANELWLKEISPGNGIVAPADTQLIAVIIDRQELADSMIFNGDITLETDAGNQNISLDFETTKEPLRINCGGNQYFDLNENTWLDDMLFLDGKIISCQDSIANTVDDGLYQTARSGLTKYELSIQENGWYRIKLHFAELKHQAAGQRVFDVLIEDSLVLKDFDIYDGYGSFSAGIQEIDVNVSDKQLDIEFFAQTGEPCISAVEIFPKPEEPTGIASQGDSKLLPDHFSLGQNYPNPFNMETKISYQLPVASHVTLEVFNILGQKQKTLLEENIAAGNHSVQWDGLDMNGNPVSSGFYIYRIQIRPKDDRLKSFNETRKMLLLK